MLPSTYRVGRIGMQSPGMWRAAGNLLDGFA